MSIDSHLNELVRRHQAIEEAILAEESHPAADDIKVHELKVKKLHLKDEIEKLRHETEAAAAALGRQRAGKAERGGRSDHRIGRAEGEAPFPRDLGVGFVSRLAPRRERRKSFSDSICASAQTAAPRTSGLSSSSRSQRRGGERGVARVADGDRGRCARSAPARSA